MVPTQRFDMELLIVMHNGEVLISCSPPVLLLLLLLCDVELYSAEKILCFAQTKGFTYFTMFKCLYVCLT